MIFRQLGFYFGIGFSLFTLVGEMAAQKPIVSVLGGYHLYEGENALLSLQLEDIQMPQRQRELKALQTRLLEFRPSKVVLAIPFEDSVWTTVNYVKYFYGSLGKNAGHDADRYLPSEVVQVGYPLARQSGHRQVYGILGELQFHTDSIQYLLADSTVTGAGELRAFLTERQSLLDSLTTQPLADLLEYLNTDAFQQQIHEPLLFEQLLSLETGSDAIGLREAANWYADNLQLFDNLIPLVESGDRVLVIIGAGHRSVLVDFVQSRNDWEYFDINSLLFER